MKSTNIEAQLKKLKSDAPDEAWVISNREKLLAQIETANLSWARRLGLHLNVGWDHLIYAPVRALVIALLLIVGFSTSMMVKASLPNSILYPGRIVIEKVELILAATPEKEAAVYNKHAQQKIADLLKLKETQADEKDIQGTAQRLEKDLAAAASSLDIAKTEDGANLGQLALDITASAQATREALDTSKEDIITAETKAVLDDVLQSTASVADRTLGVLVDMYEQDDISAQETVEKFMNIVEGQVAAVAVQIAANENVPDQAYTDMRTAGSLLSEAQASYAIEDYKAALTALSAAKELVAGIEAQLTIE